MRKTALKLAQILFGAVLFGAVLAGPTLAATCVNTNGSFESWLAAFKKEALAQGISAKVIADASPHMTFDPAIIKRDHGQAVFSQTFLQFSDRMVGGPGMRLGRRDPDAGRPRRAGEELAQCPVSQQSGQRSAGRGEARHRRGEKAHPKSRYRH